MKKVLLILVVLIFGMKADCQVSYSPKKIGLRARGIGITLDTIPYTLYISCELKGDTLYLPDSIRYMFIDGQIYHMRRKTTITFEGIRVFDDQIKAETFWEQYQKRLGILNDSPITVTPEYFTRPATGEAVKRDTTTPYPYKYFKPAVHRLYKLKS